MIITRDTIAGAIRDAAHNRPDNDPYPYYALREKPHCIIGAALHAAGFPFRS